jgi:hypothetical protein
MRNFFTILILLFLLPLSLLKAQNGSNPAPVQMDGGFDLTSRYLWRGFLFSPSASVQPYMEISKGGFTLGAWGSSTLQAFEWQEVDIYLSFEAGDFVFSVTDYFYFNDLEETPHFFDYSKDNSGHVLEFIAGFGGNERIPIRFEAGYNFFGDPSNSFYVETALMHQFQGNDVELFCGFTPNTGYYHESKKGFTQVGAGLTRNIVISEQFAIPLNVKFVYNPMLYKAFMVVMVSI